MEDLMHHSIARYDAGSDPIMDKALSRARSGE
jgi:hypothetical protein